MKQQKGKQLEEFMLHFQKGRRGITITYLVLITIVITILVRQFFTGHYEHCFTCLLTLFLFFIPSFVNKKLQINLPNTLEVIILLFIFSAEILGEISAFYLRVPWWDAMLHTMNGFLMAAIGFSLVDILNRNESVKFHLSPIFVAVVAFCFSMTIGVLWEFFEYAMDVIIKTDMQKDTILQTFATVDLNPQGENSPVLVTGIQNMILVGEQLMVDQMPCDSYTLNLGGYLDMGIVDTMMDLFVNFVGAVVFSFIGYFYIKNRGKDNWVSRLIPSKIRKSQEKTSPRP